MAVLVLGQTLKLEPVLGGIGEAVAGIRAHPEQKLGLYMRRSMINAYFAQRVRQSANDPWIRVGETRTSVKDVNLDGFPCLLLDSWASREILSHNPMEGEIHPRVVRKIVRTRKVWVAEDGSILKTQFGQTSPETFTIDVLFGDGVLYVHKTKDGKKESAQVDVTIDPVQFENEFLTMAWSGKTFKDAKTFATLDPFAGTVKIFEAKLYGSFKGLEGTAPISGVRVDVKQGKESSVVWVGTDGRLFQYDLANGDRLIVEPSVGEPGIQKVKFGGGT